MCFARRPARRPRARAGTATTSHAAALERRRNVGVTRRRVRPLGRAAAKYASAAGPPIASEWRAAVRAARAARELPGARAARRAAEAQPDRARRAAVAHLGDSGLEHRPRSPSARSTSTRERDGRPRSRPASARDDRHPRHLAVERAADRARDDDRAQPDAGRSRRRDAGRRRRGHPLQQPYRAPAVRGGVGVDTSRRRPGCRKRRKPAKRRNAVDPAAARRLDGGAPSRPRRRGPRRGDAVVARRQ